jgi:hypothetical protein
MIVGWREGCVKVGVADCWRVDTGSYEQHSAVVTERHSLFYLCRTGKLHLGRRVKSNENVTEEAAWADGSLN